MKILRYLGAVALLTAIASAQTTLQKNNQTDNINTSFAIPSPRTVTFRAGSTLNLLGTLSGTPTGGTLDLTNVNVIGLSSGVGVTNGDKGDLTVSGTGDVWTIDNLAVTNAKLAGNIDVAKLNISANAASLLGSANYAAMRALLDLEPGTDFLPYPSGTPTGSKYLRDDNSWQVITGGGDALTSSPLNQFAATTSAQLAEVISDKTGNGLLVFGTSPTITTPTLSGIVTVDGATITTASAMGANAVDVTKTLNTKTIAADATFTFSATPSANTWFSVFITNSDASAHTVTIPSSYSLAAGAAITTVSVPASGKLHLTWRYDGSAYNVYGDPVSGGGSGAPTDATYITQTANGTLSAEQALSALSTGIMRVATSTGVITSLTDSAGIAANISDETGTGPLVMRQDPLLTFPNASMGALAVDVTKRSNTKSIAVDSTLTFSATATAGATFGLTITNTDSAAHTITIPSSFSLAAQAAITSFSLPAGYQAELSWRYDGTTYFLVGEPTTINSLTGITPASADSIPVYDTSAGLDGKATISDILALGNITFGATAQAIGSTVTTMTGVNSFTAASGQNIQVRNNGATATVIVGDNNDISITGANIGLNGPATVTGNLSITGIITAPGATITSGSAMGALAIDVTKGFNTKTISADSTFTFSATPATDTFFSVFIVNSDGTDRTATIPSSKSVRQGANVTTVTVKAGFAVHLTWRYDGTNYWLYGD